MGITEWSQTLRWRLIWPSIVINLIAVALTAWAAAYILRQSLNRHLTMHGEIIAHAVNYAAESVARTETLRRFVSSIGAEREVRLVVVVGYHRPEVLAWFDRHHCIAPALRALRHGRNGPEHVAGSE